ncbi:MAG: hypothetical protein ACMG6E_06445 [Candidatus Roizmanbacteria bacterium]
MTNIRLLLHTSNINMAERISCSFLYGKCKVKAVKGEIFCKKHLKTGGKNPAEATCYHFDVHGDQSVDGAFIELEKIGDDLKITFDFRDWRSYEEAGDWSNYENLVTSVNDLTIIDTFKEPMLTPSHRAFLKVFATDLQKNDLAWFTQATFIIGVEDKKFTLSTDSGATSYLGTAMCEPSHRLPLPGSKIDIRKMSTYTLCEVCGTDFDHVCSKGKDYKELPDEAFYLGWAASLQDEPIDPNNYFGGEPLALPEHVWPCCHEHGPLMFIWQMTDQANPDDPCIIQYFMCANNYKRHNTWNVAWKGRCLNLEMDCHNFSNMHSEEEQIVRYDLKSKKNFGYLVRRFYPGNRAKFMSNPRQPSTKKDKTHVIEKSYLKWSQVKIPHCDGIDIFELQEDDFILGRDEQGRERRMHQRTYSSLQEMALKKLKEDHVLFHRIMTIPGQHDPSDFEGYIFMMQGAKHFDYFIHVSNASGIGITTDLSAHFMM